jgi:DNA sulfur modification protein DndB
VVLTITHGKSVEFARQCFHDRNWYQRRVAVPAALAMDVRDPMTQVVRALERLPMARGAILWKRQMPKKGRTHIAVATFVRTAVICFAYGIGGVGMSTAPLPEGLTAADFSQRAVMWFSKVIARLGDDMRDRETFVASSPAIWAALGALGRPMLDPQVTDDDALAAIAEGLLAKIAGVDWRKGPHWIGIALKETEGGYSFAGGAKDSGSIAYKALSDPSEHVYRVIRHKADAAAA